MKSTSLPLVFLAVLIAVSLPGSTAVPVGTCPSVDGPNPVYLTDSVRCDVFYECSNGYANEKVCPNNPYANPPANLHWNKALSVCDFPQNANCLL
ncbi:putative peritrophic matrix protein PTM1 [Daphnia pulex]|uniref:Putative peritrophic matrix protein PTM1 n=1 Tax=Daphnia pulex TaxID=6669 RepID=E9G8R9_DAPPU|nr:putative peritrophic matrix protein PTM1 [Daphnia pulex]|eukprot:EFX84020.1 putative peritrophic matrix protein PTM1 [Daphnia pulex]